MTPVLLILVQLSCYVLLAHGWVRWSDAQETLGPGVRSGHTMELYNDTLYVFGGRAREFSTRVHDPKTFSTNRTDEGIVEFSAYNNKHVTACLDESGDQESDETSEAYRKCYSVSVSEYRNDIWMYRLNCTRKGDAACISEAPDRADWANGGWQSVMPGTALGGCINYDEEKVCTHPQERYEHVGVIITEEEPVPEILTGDLTKPPAHLFVYGGYAQMCGDFCSDMWDFPLSACAANKEDCQWREIGKMGRRGPGRRTRAAHTMVGSSRLVIFGGMRLWHGFSLENSADNDWNVVADGSSDSSDEPSTALPFGGFLDDMWVFTWSSKGLVFSGTANDGYGQATRGGSESKLLDAREVSLGEPILPTQCEGRKSNCSKIGAWQQVLPREECHATPGRLWSERNDITCTIKWPPRRAAAAIASFGEEIFLHGGYSVPAFPYPFSTGRGYRNGSGAKAQDSLPLKSIVSHPSTPRFKSDLWRFSWVTGLWRELVPDVGDAVPRGRRSHTLIIAASRALILFGGFADNTLYSDVWFFNLTHGKWLEKKVFPYPQFVKNCTSDVFLNLTDGVERIVGARSVQSEPTRGRKLDGLFGRSPVPVYIPQGRRRALGWDGCRDRADGRAELGVELSYDRPQQRAGHAAVWSSSWSMLLVFGGDRLPVEQAKSGATTWPTEVAGDLWTWQTSACPLNCSMHGSCLWGFCNCADGYYGADCSNTTCPGSYCRYDDFNHEQTCSHCCAEGYNHTDEDVYVPGVRKSPCDAGHKGEENGLCDGFGMCICAPPFLGDECSIKNCKDDCTDPSRGRCQVEYPVSRCECNWPYTGDSCQETLCLNNCSYPHGSCNRTTGECTCIGINSPYNRKTQWSSFAGIDCSYVPAFAGAASQHTLLVLLGALVITLGAGAMLAQS